MVSCAITGDAVIKKQIQCRLVNRDKEMLNIIPLVKLWNIVFIQFIFLERYF